MLTQAGYDVIGIDRSEEMLSVLREKADELGLTGRLLLLRQDLLELDLYGTIRAAVSTFDTYSHIGPLDSFEKAIRKAAYFMERGGVFLFDLNTPYKHREILAGQTFDIEAEDADCHWSNRYAEDAQRVDITIDIDYHETGEHFREQFSEYSYTLDTVRALLEKYGFAWQGSLTARISALCAPTARAGSLRLSSNTHKRMKAMEQNHNMLRGISENGGIVFYGVDSTEIVRDMERLHKTSAVTTRRWAAC